jgi:hypothetical protein
VYSPAIAGINVFNLSETGDIKVRLNAMTKALKAVIQKNNNCAHYFCKRCKSFSTGLPNPDADNGPARLSENYKPQNL